MDDNKTRSFVFYLSLAIVGGVALAGLTIPQPFYVLTKALRQFISRDFGWYYLLLLAAMVCFCVFFIVTPAGQIRLGDPHSEPEHSKFSWLAMLFSAGMGIGLVFYGAAEPLSHFAVSAPAAEVGSQQALEDALKYTFFHWGIHAWAAYGLVALAIAYFQFRKKESILLSVTLKPLFGKRAEGFIGTLVDSATIFATVVGVATSLGYGAIQINSGLHFLWQVPESQTVQMLIIAVTTVLFLLSAMSGVSRGVKFLSNLNVILALLLLACVIATGPTVLILNNFVDSIGSYIQGFFRMSFRTAAYDAARNQWIQQWTIFYWAWWLSWTPFVGIFIARISKGRTIREFLVHVMLVPTLLTMLWFSAFGTLATHLQTTGIELIDLDTENVLFGALAHCPFGFFMSVLAVFLIFSFFITSADSAVFVLAMLSEKGALHPTNRTKLIWGVLLSVLAGTLLAAGGLDALQNVLIIVALPFSVAIVLMMIALYIELEHERNEMGLYIKPDTYPEKDKPFRSYED